VTAGTALVLCSAGMRAWVALLLLAAPALAEERTPLQSEAHGIIGRYCGRCHDGAVATAKPKALAVFDLQNASWFRGLTNEQLAHIMGRMDSFGVPSDQKIRIKAFVDAELAARR